MPVTRLQEADDTSMLSLERWDMKRHTPQLVALIKQLTSGPGVAHLAHLWQWSGGCGAQDQAEYTPRHR